MHHKVLYKGAVKAQKISINSAVNIIDAMLRRKSVRFTRMISDIFDYGFFADERKLKYNIKRLKDLVRDLVTERKKLIDKRMKNK